MIWHDVLMRPDNLYEVILRRKLISGGGSPAHEATSYTGSFFTDMTAPLKKLLVSLEPIQSGSGTPSPDNVRPISGHTEVVTHRTGKNLLPPTLPSNIIAGDLRDNEIVSATNARVFAIPVPKNTDLVIQKEINDRIGANVALCDTGDIAVGTMVYNILGLTNVATQTLNTGDHEWMVIKSSTLEGADTFWTTRELMVSVGTTRQDYVAPSEDYSTYTTDLGRTVYGGTLDVVSGVLTVDRQYLTISDFSSWGGSGTSGGGLYWVNVPKSYPAALNSNDNICSHAAYSETAWTSRIPVFATNAGGFPARIYVASNSFADFQTEYASLQMVYMLAEPQTYQLTPQQIRTLKGNNVVTAEGADVTEVVYLTHLVSLGNPMSAPEATDESDEPIEEEQEESDQE